MRFTTLFAVIASAVLLTALPSLAQKGPAGAPAGNATDLTSAVASLPPCFLTCAGESAVKVGCKGLVNDLPCVCASPSFATDTQQCITASTNATCTSVAKNTTVLGQANQVFVSVCSAISNSSTAAAGGAANSSAAGHGAAGSASAGGNGSNMAAPAAGTNAAGVMQPAMSHVAAAAALVFSTLAFGSATLL